ncbi:peptide ABC transporter permease [Pacificimonas flava]|uniref:Peptide ABC transporter permease n=2 Tax=Pacificimonas TaxID=1960290 RepID=A0A219B8L2_9SPHN|nr:peptide ABC transporter permease [Pacificimonas aurantium]OWV34621.1 peptide ABC transporter permease [Pacificimonas flava]
MRGAEIILRSRRRRVIFVAGLAAILLLGLILRFAA